MPETLFADIAPAPFLLVGGAVIVAGVVGLVGVVLGGLWLVRRNRRPPSE